MIYSHFSVTMCVYGKDRADWFDEAMGSVFNQTVKPSEVVLVVDGPVPDELNDIIKKYEQYDIFNVIRLKENVGLGNARRVGLEACTNELVAIMDSDDICLGNRFEQQLKVIDGKDIDVVGGNISEFIDTEDNIVSYRTVPTSDEEIKTFMRKRCPFNHMSVMFKKSSVQNAGGYLDWHYNEDYYLWLRMYLSGCKFANTGTVLVNARVGKDMYNRRGGIKYFKSEKKLQKYMLKNKIIGVGTYIINVTKRFIVQVLMPNKMRAWAFKRFAREKE